MMNEAQLIELRTALTIDMFKSMGNIGHNLATSMGDGKSINENKIESALTGIVQQAELKAQVQLIETILQGGK